MSELLLAYDGSDHSGKALDKAISLAKSYGNFKKAYVTFRSLLRDIQPTELYSRIFAFILFVLGMIATIVTQLIFSAFTN